MKLPNNIEQRVLYGVACAAIAWAVLMSIWQWGQSFKHTEYLFHQHISTEEFKEELRLIAQEETYKAWENMKGIK